MEMSTVENEAVVRRVSEFVGEAQKRVEAVTPSQQAIYDVDYLVLEANSGASFEQYFRWASVDEILRVVPALREVGLEDMGQLSEWPHNRRLQLTAR